MQTQELVRPPGTVYFASSLLLSDMVREDLLRLYNFVHLVDSYANTLPQNITAFKEVEQLWYKLADEPDVAMLQGDIGSPQLRAVKDICQLMWQYDFERQWVQQFLLAKGADTQTTAYASFEESLQHVHGSAEVVALMVSRLLAVSPQLDPILTLQGRAIQWLAFIRDIQEHNTLGKRYFPQEDLKEFGLKDLTQPTALANPEGFGAFIGKQIGRYYQWQDEANQEFAMLPRRIRIGVRTLADEYDWTARQIQKNPLVVFDYKITPSKYRIILSLIRHVFD